MCVYVYIYIYIYVYMYICVCVCACVYIYIMRMASVLVSVSGGTTGRGPLNDADDCLPPETPSHTRTARAQPPAAHRRMHSRPHPRRHGEHNPTVRQPHSNGLCSPPKEAPRPGSALRHVDARPSTKGADALIVPNGTLANDWERRVISSSFVPFDTGRRASWVSCHGFSVCVRIWVPHAFQCER